MPITNPNVRFLPDLIVEKNNHASLIYPLSTCYQYSSQSLCLGIATFHAYVLGHFPEGPPKSRDHERVGLLPTKRCSNCPIDSSFPPTRLPAVDLLSTISVESHDSSRENIDSPADTLTRAGTGNHLKLGFATRGRRLVVSIRLTSLAYIGRNLLAST